MTRITEPNHTTLTLGDKGAVRMRELRKFGFRDVGFQAPDKLSETYTIELPAALPANSGLVQISDTGLLSFKSGIRVDSNGDLIAVGGFRHTPDGWFQNPTPLGQTNIRLARFEPGITSWIAPRQGSLTGLSAFYGTTITGGTATLTVWKLTLPSTEVSLGLSVSLDSSNRVATALQAKDTDFFQQNDMLFIRITTTSTWAPDTDVIQAQIEVEI